MRWILSALLLFVAAACGEEEASPAYTFDAGRESDVTTYYPTSVSYEATCPTSDDIVSVTLAGTLGEERVSVGRGGYDDSAAPTHLSVSATYFDLELDWDEHLVEGVEKRATGTLNVKGKDYCILEAKVLLVPAEEQAERGEVVFHISRVREGADCAGRQLEADLSGCLG